MSKSFAITISAFLFVLCNAASGLRYNEFEEKELPRSELNDIERVSYSIKKNYPPDKYYYVMIGEGPLPFEVVLLEEGIEGICHIPLSRKNHGTTKTTLEWDLKDPTKREELEDRFRQFLPDQRTLGERKLLFIDYVNTGDSLRTVADAFEVLKTKDVIWASYHQKSLRLQGGKKAGDFSSSFDTIYLGRGELLRDIYYHRFGSGYIPLDLKYATSNRGNPRTSFHFIETRSLIRQARDSRQNGKFNVFCSKILNLIRLGL